MLRMIIRLSRRCAIVVGRHLSGESVPGSNLLKLVAVCTILSASRRNIIRRGTGFLQHFGTVPIP